MYSIHSPNYTKQFLCFYYKNNNSSKIETADKLIFTKKRKKKFFKKEQLLQVTSNKSCKFKLYVLLRVGVWMRHRFYNLLPMFISYRSLFVSFFFIPEAQ